MASLFASLVTVALLLLLPLPRVDAQGCTFPCNYYAGCCYDWQTPCNWYGCGWCYDYCGCGCCDYYNSFWGGCCNGNHQQWTPNVPAGTTYSYSSCTLCCGYSPVTITMSGGSSGVSIPNGAVQLITASGANPTVSVSNGATATTITSTQGGTFNIYGSVSSLRVGSGSTVYIQSGSSVPTVTMCGTAYIRASVTTFQSCSGTTYVTTAGVSVTALTQSSGNLYVQSSANVGTLTLGTNANAYFDNSASVTTISVTGAGSNTITFGGSTSFTTLTVVNAVSSFTLTATSGVSVGCMYFGSTVSSLTMSFSGIGFSRACHFVSFANSVTTMAFTVNGGAFHNIGSYSIIRHTGGTMSDVIITYDTSRVIANDVFYANAIGGSYFRISFSGCNRCLGGPGCGSIYDYAITANGKMLNTPSGNSASSGTAISIRSSSSLLIASSHLIYMGSNAYAVTITSTGSTLTSSGCVLNVAGLMSSLTITSWNSNFRAGTSLFSISGSYLSTGKFTVDGGSSWKATNHGLEVAGSGASSAVTITNTAASEFVTGQNCVSILGSVTNLRMETLSSSLFQSGATILRVGSFVSSGAFTVTSSSSWLATTHGVDIGGAASSFLTVILAGSTVSCGGQTTQIGGAITTMDITVSASVLTANGHNLYQSGAASTSSNVLMTVVAGATSSTVEATTGINWYFAGPLVTTTGANLLIISGQSVMRSPGNHNMYFGSTASLAVSVIGVNLASTPSFLVANKKNFYFASTAPYLRLHVLQSTMTAAGEHNLYVVGAIGSGGVDSTTTLTNAYVQAKGVSSVELRGGATRLTISATGVGWNLLDGAPAPAPVGIVSMTGAATTAQITMLTTSLTVTSSSLSVAGVFLYDAGTSNVMNGVVVSMTGVTLNFVTTGAPASTLEYSFLRTYNSRLLDSFVTITGSKLDSSGTTATHRLEVIDMQAATRLYSSTSPPTRTSNVLITTIEFASTTLRHGALVLAATSGSIETSSITVQCLNFATTLLSFVDCRGPVTNSWIQTDMVHIGQSQAIVALIWLGHASTLYNDIKIRFTRVHVPIIVHSESGATGINGLSGITVPCSLYSWYPMSEGFFETPLVPLVYRPPRTSCGAREYAPNVCYYTETKSLSLTVSESLSLSLSPSDSLTLSDEDTQSDTEEVTLTDSKESSMTVTTSDPVSHTRSGSASASRQLTATRMRTPTLSVTVSGGSGTVNRRVRRSRSKSETPSATQSSSTSKSASGSSSTTYSHTKSEDASQSRSGTSTVSLSTSSSTTTSNTTSPSGSRSSSSSFSISKESSISESATASASDEASASVSTTASRSSSGSDSASESEVLTASWSGSSSVSEDRSRSPSGSASSTSTETEARTKSVSITLSQSRSSSRSVSDERSQSDSGSWTMEGSRSATGSESAEASPSETLTRVTWTPEPTATVDSPSLTSAVSMSESVTSISSRSATASSSITPTNSSTPSPSDSESQSPSESPTPSSSMSDTETATPSASRSPSRSATQSSSAEARSKSRSVSFSAENPSREVTCTMTETGTVTVSLTGVVSSVTVQRTKSRSGNSATREVSSSMRSSTPSFGVSVSESLSLTLSKATASREGTTTQSATALPSVSQSGSNGAPSLSRSSSLSAEGYSPTFSRTRRGKTHSVPPTESGSTSVTTTRTEEVTQSEHSGSMSPLATLSRSPSAMVESLSRSASSSVTPLRGQRSRTGSGEASSSRTLSPKTSSRSGTAVVSSLTATPAPLPIAYGGGSGAALRLNGKNKTSTVTDSWAATRTVPTPSVTRHPVSETGNLTASARLSSVTATATRNRQMPGSATMGTGTMDESATVTRSESTSAERMTVTATATDDLASASNTRAVTRSARRRTEELSVTKTVSETATAASDSVLASATQTVETTLTVTSTASPGTGTATATRKHLTTTLTLSVTVSSSTTAGTATGLSTATKNRGGSATSSNETTTTVSHTMRGNGNSSLSATLKATKTITRSGVVTATRNGVEGVAAAPMIRGRTRSLGPSVSVSRVLSASPSAGDRRRGALTASATLHIVTTTVSRPLVVTSTRSATVSGTDQASVTAVVTLTGVTGSSTAAASASGTNVLLQLSATETVTPSEATLTLAAPSDTISSPLVTHSTSASVVVDSAGGNRSHSGDGGGNNAALSNVGLVSEGLVGKNLTRGASLVMVLNLVVLALGLISSLLFAVGVRGSERKDEPERPVTLWSRIRTVALRVLPYHAVVGPLLACTSRCVWVHSGASSLHVNVVMLLSVVLSSYSLVPTATSAIAVTQLVCIAAAALHIAVDRLFLRCVPVPYEAQPPTAAEPGDAASCEAPQIPPLRPPVADEGASRQTARLHSASVRSLKDLGIVASPRSQYSLPSAHNPDLASAFDFDFAEDDVIIDLDTLARPPSHPSPQVQRKSSTPVDPHYHTPSSRENPSLVDIDTLGLFSDFTGEGMFSPSTVAFDAASKPNGVAAPEFDDSDDGGVVVEDLDPEAGIAALFVVDEDNAADAWFDAVADREKDGWKQDFANVLADNEKGRTATNQTCHNSKKQKSMLSKAAKKYAKKLARITGDDLLQQSEGDKKLDEDLVEHSPVTKFKAPKIDDNDLFSSDGSNDAKQWISSYIKATEPPPPPPPPPPPVVWKIAVVFGLAACVVLSLLLGVASYATVAVEVMIYSLLEDFFLVGVLAAALCRWMDSKFSTPVTTVDHSEEVVGMK